MAAGAAKVAVVAERKDFKMKKNYEENDLEIDTDMICDGMKSGMDSISFSLIQKHLPEIVIYLVC